jgi:hypothetical protein
MTIKRSVSVLAFPLALALVASPALAKSAKEQPKPANNAPLIVDSPNMVTSVRDRHPELNPAPPRTAPVTKITTTAAPSAQRRPQGKNSGKPVERAQEIPLALVRR